MAPQLADERLKSPAPTLLITRHEANAAGSGGSDAFYRGAEENGVAGYHTNQYDDRMSESVHSQDSQHSDDSYLEPVDQVFFSCYFELITNLFHEVFVYLPMIVLKYYLFQLEYTYMRIRV